MKLHITANNAFSLIKGASIFTTGGGAPIHLQNQAISKIKTLKTSVQSIDEFPNEGYLCTIAELGPSNAPLMDKKPVVRKMLNLLETVTNKQIVGIYAPEIGQEAIVLETSHYLKLPIADFDPVGCRAVPYLDITIFNVKKMDFTFSPLVISSDQREILFMDGKVSNGRTEDTLRSMTCISKTGILLVLGGIISVRDVKKHKISNNSYTSAFEYGKINSLDTLLGALKPELILDVRVEKKIQLNEKGFSNDIIVVRSKENQIYKLVVLNEVMFLLNQHNKIVSSIPDRIHLIDPKKLEGVTGALLDKDTRLIIATTKPSKDWTTKIAQKVFGKERLSFLLKNIPNI